MNTIDINCDVGEGVGNEEQLMPLINSCNIASGGHAGDVHTMLEVVRLAKQHKVKIGAHPSYPDRLNFGRKPMSISMPELQKSLKDQLQAFQSIVHSENTKIHHIKAHGALYNQIARDEALAEVYLEALQDYQNRTFLYVPYRSAIAKIALRKGFSVRYEAFGDRNYNPDLSLVSRQLENALIHAPERVLQHLLPIIKENRVFTVSEKYTEIKADTVCIHGDTSSALQILMYLSQELPKHGVQLA
ncbi:5-oxoprolinase subunit PxpA [Flagellimonas onchidii]|uniref:5-oxoprolinase subunit PxpA n=1 Tax=Flagellimonas onchidii TaxID=2562684 RepID=UPI0010A5D355|nr:5-oxoprolinase subunit PxpA [Allomuricauda onchidii]